MLALTRQKKIYLRPYLPSVFIYTKWNDRIWNLRKVEI